MTNINQARGTPTNASEMLELLADANDHILERASSNLDEASGSNKKIDPLILEVSQAAKISGSWNKRPGLKVSRFIMFSHSSQIKL